MATAGARVAARWSKKTSAPLTLIGKFASSDREAREIADTFGFYESEVRFYRELASETPLRSPECLYAEHDAETQDFALLLEDVRDAAMADQVLGCSPERAELAIRSVARMHGSFWGDARLDRLPWLHRLRDPNFLVEVPAMFRRNPPVSLERLVGRVPEWFPPVAERYAACLPAMLRALDALPRTFIHGDYRLDNMLFGAGAGAPPLTVLDWQIALNGPGEARRPTARPGAPAAVLPPGLPLLPPVSDERRRGDGLRHAALHRASARARDARLPRDRGPRGARAARAARPQLAPGRAGLHSDCVIRDHGRHAPILRRLLVVPQPLLLSRDRPPGEA